MIYISEFKGNKGCSSSSSGGDVQCCFTLAESLSWSHFHKVAKVTPPAGTWRGHGAARVQPVPAWLPGWLPGCMTCRRKGSVHSNPHLPPTKIAFYFTYISWFNSHADSFYFVRPRLRDIHLRDFCRQWR